MTKLFIANIFIRLSQIKCAPLIPDMNIVKYLFKIQNNITNAPSLGGQIKGVIGIVVSKSEI